MLCEEIGRYLNAAGHAKIVDVTLFFKLFEKFVESAIFDY